MTISFTAFLFAASGQQKGIDVNIRQMPANRALMQLHEQYGIQISFNDTELSQYNITLKGHFTSVDDVLLQLMKSLPFAVEKMGDAWVVYFDNTKANLSILRTLSVTGRVMDISTGEALPYGTVEVNGELRLTDDGGRFSYIAFVDEYLSIKARYLGYAPVDTLLMSQQMVDIKMVVVANVLSETVVVGSSIDNGIQTGQSMGQARINPRVVSYLPGGWNNGVSQLLTMQPGIQSAGTAAGSLSMWGSYPGQNKVVYDGMTLFTFPYMTERLFPLNPAVVKDIRVDKGALGTNYGDRVGGVLDITGIEGNRTKAEGALVADANVGNLMVSFPVTTQSTLVAAARQTWWPTYTGSLNGNTSVGGTGGVDVRLPDECDYRDINLKYTWHHATSDRLSVSFYGNHTTNNHSLEYPATTLMTMDTRDASRQTGGTLQYGHIWRNGVNTNVRLVASTAQGSHQMDSAWTTTGMKPENRNVMYLTQMISENEVSINNLFPLNSKQFVETGLSYHNIHTRFDFMNSDNTNHSITQMNKTSAFLRNHIFVNKYVLMDIGVRIDYLPGTNKLFVQPRIKSSVGLTPSLKVHLSWGIYAQHLSLTPIADASGNIEYVWQGYHKSTDFMQSGILACGFTYKQDSWIVNTEMYVKSVEGLGRITQSDRGLSVIRGRAKTSGVDVFVKKKIGSHAIIQSCTLSDTRELFDGETVYHPAPFNRGLELKTIALFNFYPVKMSLVYVYGSTTSTNNWQPLAKGDYGRLDAMMSYQRHMAKLNLETGLSAFNVFDRANESSLQIHRYTLPNSGLLNVGTGGMPFYGTLFVRIAF